MRRVIISATLLAALWLCPSAYAQTYAALGDSYATGASDAQASSILPGACHRSTTSWAYSVFAGARAAGAVDALRFVACPAAVIDSLYDSTGPEPAQITAVTASTRLATLSIGGNDAGFGPVTADCLAAPGCRRSGRAARTEADEGLELLRTRLADVYTDVARRMAPGGRLVVTGYPRLFSATLESSATCVLGAGGSVLGADAAWMNTTVARANGLIAAATRTASGRADRGVRVVYASPDPEFAGHRLCDANPWIGDSLHPDTDGQGAYARAVCATRVLGIRPTDCVS